MNASMLTIRWILPGHGKNEGPDDRESDRVVIARAPFVPQQEREGDPQSDELRHGEVDEDNPPLQDVDAEIGVDQDQEHAPKERVEQERQGLHFVLRLLHERRKRLVHEGEPILGARHRPHVVGNDDGARRPFSG